MRWYLPEYPHVLIDMAGQVSTHLDSIAPASEQALTGLEPTELEEALGSAKRVWLVAPENTPEGSSPYAGASAWMAARATTLAQSTFGGRYGGSSVHLYAFDADRRAVPIEHTRDRLRIDNEHEIAVDLAPSDRTPFQLTLENTTLIDCDVTYTAATADFMAEAADFDRSWGARSLWRLKRFPTLRESRVAMCRPVRGKSESCDVLACSAPLPCGSYRLFIEQFSSALPAAPMTLLVGERTFPIPPLEGVQSPEWQWKLVGCWDKIDDQPAQLRIVAGESPGHPEVFAIFSRLCINLGGAPEPGQTVLPDMTSGPVSILAGELRTLRIAPTETFRWLSVLVSNQFDSKELRIMNRE